MLIHNLRRPFSLETDCQGLFFQICDIQNLVKFPKIKLFEFTLEKHSCPKISQFLVKKTLILANNRCLLLTALGATIKFALFSLTQDWLSTIGCISYVQSQGRNRTKKGFQQPVMPGNRLEVVGPDIISLLPQLGYMW